MRRDSCALVIFWVGHDALEHEGIKPADRALCPKTSMRAHHKGGQLHEILIPFFPKTFHGKADPIRFQPTAIAREGIIPGLAPPNRGVTKVESAPGNNPQFASGPGPVPEVVVRRAHDLPSREHSKFPWCSWCGETP